MTFEVVCTVTKHANAWLNTALVLYCLGYNNNIIHAEQELPARVVLKRRHQYHSMIGTVSQVPTASTIKTNINRSREINLLWKGSYRWSKEFNIRWCLATSPQQPRDSMSWGIVCRLKLSAENSLGASVSRDGEVNGLQQVRTVDCSIYKLVQ